MKIAIIGYSGSGKSTLAKALGEKYHLPILYLDKIRFEENWKIRDDHEARERVKAFMENKEWVIDGNYYGFFQKERLSEADYLIFMNFSRLSCFFRALKRNHQFKNRTRESMSDGCIEKMDAEFVWWILYEGRTKPRRAHYRAILETYPEKAVVLKNQRDLDRFLANPFADKKYKNDRE